MGEFFKHAVAGKRTAACAFAQALFGAVLVALCTAFVACSSAPAKKNADPAPVADSVQAASTAVDMEMRGLTHEADSMWMLAWRYDPQSRYLAFKIAEKMLAVGADSIAASIAKQANNLKGKKTVSQYELMAHVYLKEGVADSARKYFVLALDSSKYQDMKMLYDYSLFLEAVQDKKELVRVYDMLLPQTNYIQSLFARQVNLLVELGRDSALVDLFGRAHDATGHKEKLAKMVQVLVMQKRFAEARAIADTITSSLEDDGKIIELALLTYADAPKEDMLAFLKKKYYNDGVRVPELVYHLGLSEYIQHEVDSARVHLEDAHLKLVNDREAGAHACRTLSAMAFGRGENKVGVRYAEQADSLLAGEGKVFLAIALGTAKEYDRAYALLDSMLGVWINWRPMEGVADSVLLKKLKTQAMAKYRRFQRAYADVLMIQARDLEGQNAFTSVINSSLAGIP